MSIPKEIYVCTGRSCKISGARAIFRKIKAYFKKNKEYIVKQCPCLGYCGQAVNARIGPKTVHFLTRDNCIEKITNPSKYTSSKKDEKLQLNDFLGDI